MIDSICKQVAGCISLVMHRVIPSRQQATVGVLLYHRIAEHAVDLPEPTINVSPKTFREQLDGLQQRGFQFQHLSEMQQRCKGNDALPDKAVVVTFDDGYENVFLNAWPVLRELEIPATIFVNTAELDTDQPFACDQWGQQFADLAPQSAYRPLQYDQCREMIDSGLVTIGAHTHSHADFRGRPDELHDDLCTNVSHLREHLELTDVPFAFPYGRVSLGFAGGELTEAARRTGVTCALTTECDVNRPTDDPFSWGRFNVYEADTPAMLEAKLAGWYGWAPKLQERVVSTLKRITPTRLERQA